MLRIVEYIDKQNPLKATYVIILSVILRGMLEGSFEVMRNLHFQLSLYKAFLFFFLHQFSFYFAAFLLLSIIVSLISRKEVFKTYSFIATFSFIIILPPIIDFFSGGGYKLKYIFSGNEVYTVIVNFFNPFYDLSKIGITYGMRLEITLAIMGIMLYTFIHTKNILRSLISGLATFFILLFLGSIPYIFLWIFKVSYDVAFRSYSFMYEDTQRYSMLNLLVIFLSLMVISSLYDRRKSLVLFTLRIQKLPFYLSMGLVGFFLGYKIAGHLWPHPFKNPFDYMAILGLMIALTLSHHFGVLINDINDYEIDRVNNKETSVSTGKLSIYEAKVSAGIMLVLASAFYLCLNFDTFILGLATLGLAFAYSVEPLRTKRFYLLSTLTLGMIAVLCQFLGASLWMKDKTLLIYPYDVVLITLIGVGFGFMVKDVEDYKGDKMFGIRTNYTVFGMKLGRILSGIFTTSVFIIIPLVLRMNIYVVIWCALLGIMAGYLASREKFYEIPLWVLFFLMLIPVSYFYLKRDVKANFEVRRDNPYSELLGMLSYDKEKGLYILERLLELMPCDRRFFNQRLLYLYYEKPDSFLTYFENLRRRCKLDDKSFIIAAAYYLRNGDMKNSERLAKYALRVGGFEALYILEIIYDESGDLDKALKCSSMIKRYKPKGQFIRALMIK